MTLLGNALHYNSEPCILYNKFGFDFGLKGLRAPEAQTSK